MLLWREKIGTGDNIGVQFRTMEVWGDTYDSYLEPLRILQKQAIRTITSSGRLDHTAPLFKQRKALQLDNIHKYKITLIMFKVWHNMVPNVFASLFARVSDTHTHTRQQFQFKIPNARTDYMKRAISNKGARIWNKYCITLTTDCSFLSFKIALKHHLNQRLIPDF